MSTHRPTTTWMAALLTACLLLGVGATASAAPVTRLTEARVKKIATKVTNKVLLKRSPSLSVARATSADTLGGAGPATYLDQIASGTIETTSPATIGKTEILPSVTITVPPGVSFARVTGTANFSGTGVIAIFVVPGETACDLLSNDSIARPYLRLSDSRGQLVYDRVVPVRTGAQSFHLCGSIDTGSTVTLAFRTLIVETVAKGATGGTAP